MPLMFDREAMMAKAAEFKAELQEKVKPILERSFNHHDTKQNGVLDVEEAAVFFSHFVAEEGEFLSFCIANQVKIGIEASSQMLTSMFEDDTAAEDSKATLAPHIEAMVAMINSKFKEAGEDYKANKAERDAKAFTLMDLNGDGTLQKEEFIQTFTDDVKMKSIMDACFDSAKVTQEVMQVVQAKQKEARENPDGCKQQ